MIYDETRTFLFFGAGEMCVRLLEWFEYKNFPFPLGVCENNKEKQGKTIKDIPIYSLQDALEKYKNPNILITSTRYGIEISQQLEDFLPKEQILSLFLNQESFYEYHKNLSPQDYPEALKDWYFFCTGSTLDLDNPKTFNEKIQWLKLYDSTPVKTSLADKYLVRQWIENEIGAKYLIPLLGVWDSFDEIDFDTLPDAFALKTNHGSGWNYIITDKGDIDKEKMKASFDYWMGLNFAFYAGLELQYQDIIPKIIAEEYIDNGEEIVDYRFFCSYGKTDHVWVDIKSGTPNHERNVFDFNWDICHHSTNYPPLTSHNEIPQNLRKMICLSTQLSKKFAFVRVDFYEVKGKIYFGEMTFTPQSGVGKWTSKEIEILYGDLITLPKNKE